MARVFDIVAILMDGSTPSGNDTQLEQEPYPLPLAQGSDALLRFTVRRQSQALVDLTGCTITFGWGKTPIDSAQETSPTLQRNAVNQSPLANGVAHGLIIPADTLQMKVSDDWRWAAWIALADTTRQPIVPLSPVLLDGSPVIPGAPVSAPTYPTQANAQSGVATFTAETEKTITLAAAYLTTGYNIVLTPSDTVAVYYEKLSTSQFKIHTTAPFTGEVSWRTAP